MNDQATGTVAAEPVAPKVVLEKQNGVTKPKAGTKTGRVWEIADSISAQTGKPALRGAVMEQCRAEGINDGTSATQYAKWCSFYNVSKADRQEAREAAKPAEEAAPAADAAPEADDDGDDDGDDDAADED